MAANGARGEVARAALVASAERLFAERGIQGVSLRDVSADAGQRNHSAAQYHFEHRQGLVAAVYETRMALVDAHRRDLLARLRAEGRGNEVAALVEATVVPLLAVVAETDGWYARFLDRTRWDPYAWDVQKALPVAKSFREVVRALNRALAVLPASVRRQRIDQMLTLVVGTLAGWEGAPARGEPRMARTQLAHELVATATALLTAPTAPTAPTERTESSTSRRPASRRALTGARG